MIYAIRTARTQPTGYDVYRVADGSVLATFATAGQASAYLGTLPRPGILDYLRDWRDKRQTEPDPSPQLAAALRRVDALLAEAAAARTAGQGV